MRFALVFKIKYIISYVKLYGISKYAVFTAFNSCAVDSKRLSGVRCAEEGIIGLRYIIGILLRRRYNKPYSVIDRSFFGYRGL